MKKINYLFIGILVLGLVTAGLTALSRDIILTKERKTALVTIGLTDYQTTEYQIGNEIERCLYKFRLIDKCQRFSETSTTAQRNKWEEDTINKIADATIKRKRNLQGEKIKTGEGTTIIK